MNLFDPKQLEQLYKPPNDSSGEQNGQTTIIGGSELFHGAPIFALRAASRIVDMVFFTSPESSVGDVANQIKATLSSFIWVPFNEVEDYVSKSDAVLIGPGLMRFARESVIRNQELGKKNFDEVGEKTYEITKRLLLKFSDKKWVIDAGSLQVIGPELLPKGCIITPNKKEFEMLFNREILRLSSKGGFAQDDKADEKIVPALSNVETMAKKYKCIIVLKGPETIVSNGDETVLVEGGNAGLTKGGTGDTLAGLTVALLAKNEAFLAASAASFIVKKTAEELEKTVGLHFNADDLASNIYKTLHKYQN